MSLTVESSPSPFVHGVEPITETDAQIAAALADAELPPLLPALAYLTGDLSVLRPELQVDPLMIGMPQGGLSDEQQASDCRGRIAAPHRLGDRPRAGTSGDRARPGQRLAGAQAR